CVRGGVRGDGAACLRPRCGRVVLSGRRRHTSFSRDWSSDVCSSDLFTIMDHGVSGRDLILFFGGLFLVFKSTMEIWHSVEGEEEQASGTGGAVKAGFVGIILQIAVIDIVFSLDSVITAVGLVDYVQVMIAAIVIAVGVMM